MDISERLLTPGEVALLFKVDPKTVTRWADQGRIGSIRTPGGHRRFHESEVTGLLADPAPTDISRSPGRPGSPAITASPTAPARMPR